MTESVFQRKDVSARSLQDIADAAGLARGAICWHSEDKADLFDAMLQVLDTCLRGMTACATPSVSPVTMEIDITAL